MTQSRRLVLSRSATLIAAASTGLLLPEIVRAQGAKVRIGLMLPYTGTFAQLGVAIENGLRLAIDEQGGKLGGREIEWFKVDDESDPSKGVENATKLVQRDKVDVIIGTVHSGVQMGIHKVARDTGVLSLIPNAGVHAATRALCAPNVFRTSFTNSQPTLALGKVLVGGLLSGRLLSPAFVLSLGGTLSATAAMALAARLPLGFVGVSAVGAQAHALAQLALARWLLLRSPAVWSLVPLLGVAALATGAVTGAAVGQVARALADGPAGPNGAHTFGRTDDKSGGQRTEKRQGGLRD